MNKEFRNRNRNKIGEATYRFSRLPVFPLSFFARLVFVLLFFPGLSSANILVISYDDHPVHQQVINGIESRKTSRFNTIKTVSPGSLNRQTISKSGAKIIIALGHKGAAAANSLKNNKLPIIFALLPKKSADNYLRCPSASCPQKRAALYLEQPWKRQLKMIEILFPDFKNIAFLYSDFSSESAAELNALAQRQNFKTFSDRIDKADQIALKSKRLFNEAALFIALPDPLIHNRLTIPQLLLGSYRQRVPVIGFSSSYVTAGAIASLYSSTGNFSKQLTEIVDQFFSYGRFTPAGIYPKYFEVRINYEVARSLNLRLSKEETVKSRLWESAATQ